MRLNSYQIRAYLHFLKTNDSVAIEASAGTGKTTFIVGCSHKLKYPNNTLFVAYTSTAKDVMCERMPHAEDQVKTTYSIGYSAINNLLGYTPVNKYKTRNRVLELKPSIVSFLHGINQRVHKNNVTVLCKEIEGLYNLALCNLALDVEKIEHISHLNSYFFDDPEYHRFKAATVYQMIQQLLTDPISEIDFSEMISLPTLLKADLLKYPSLFIDESQDLSLAQLALVKNSTFSNSQALIVGDPRQSIFNFAGSIQNSFSKIVDQFNAKIFPMPINYRCGKQIIQYANEVYDCLEANPNASEGEVLFWNKEKTFQYINSTSRDLMVISRTNAYVCQIGLRLMKLKKKFYFPKGKFESQLLNRITQLKRDINFPELKTFLEYSSVSTKSVFKATLDETILYFLQEFNLKSWTNLSNKITFFFYYARRESNIKLSSIHSSKGLESDVVIIWGTNKIPHQLSTTADQLQQETNLDYVARTRAKNTLINVEI